MRNYFCLNFSLNLTFSPQKSTICLRDTNTSIEGVTPLFLASLAGHFKIIQFLVRYGANVNCVTRNKSTPLRVAYNRDDYKLVEFLVENGADIEFENEYRYSYDY